MEERQGNGEAEKGEEGIQHLEPSVPGPCSDHETPLSEDPKMCLAARGPLGSLQPSLPCSHVLWLPGPCPNADTDELTLLRSGVRPGQMNLLLSSECRPCFGRTLGGSGRVQKLSSLASLKTGILKLILPRRAAVRLWLWSVFNLVMPLANCVWSGSSAAFRSNFQW